MIALLFTKSDLPGSRMIRWATGESVSHFAIELDQKIVFHSNFKGVHLDWLKKFKVTNDIVYRLELLPMRLETEERIYCKLINRYDGNRYDFGALLFWMVALIGHRVFRKPLPERNLWASNNAFLCVELAECLDAIGIQLTDLDMMLPERLYFKLKGELYGHIPEP